MSPRGIPRTAPCTPGHARTRLSQAEKFLEVAEIVATEELEESSSVATALAVLAGIAASDAACCAALGRRARGQDHHEAEALLRQVEPQGPGMAASLKRLLDRKDEAHYGLYNVSRQNLTAALRQARQILDEARAVLDRARR